MARFKTKPTVIEAFQVSERIVIPLPKPFIRISSSFIPATISAPMLRASSFPVVRKFSPSLTSPWLNKSAINKGEWICTNFAQFVIAPSMSWSIHLASARSVKRRIFNAVSRRSF